VREFCFEPAKRLSCANDLMLSMRNKALYSALLRQPTANIEYAEGLKTTKTF